MKSTTGNLEADDSASKLVSGDHSNTGTAAATPSTTSNASDDCKWQQRRADQELQLANDYATISKLMVELDTEVQCFTKGVGSTVRSVPAHDGLSAMLETFGDDITYNAGSNGETGSNNNETAAATDDDVDASTHQRSSKKMRRDDNVNAAAAAASKDEAIMGDEAVDKGDPLVFL